MTQDVIRHEDQYYILSTSALADARTRVLKHGDTFAVFDRHGDVHPVGRGQQGLFHQDTRYLSRWVLRVAHNRPLLLSSTVREGDAVLTVDLANADVVEDGRLVVAADRFHVFRTSFLWEGACYVRLRLRSYATEPVRIDVSLEYESDFADIFEVRGARRPARGTLLAPAIEESAVVLRYVGLDALERRTRIAFSPAPVSVGPEAATFDVALAPHECVTLYATISCEKESHRNGGPLAYDDAIKASRAALDHADATACEVTTSNEQFNEWLARSRADLWMMTTETPYGMYPYAGVPWFSCPFGRDGVITALETLWLAPEIATGVLRFLAAHQATMLDPERDAEPGKILHEMRRGEMAVLGEIPFGCYYGSIDVTPLFVMLAAAHYRRTADLELVRELWPHVEDALAWIDESGDLDGDGFVEYVRRSHTGLVHQGWKDSHDSISHADGSEPELPIALCEVQAYVYAAKRDAAALARALGRDERAAQLVDQAERLKARFRDAFWSDEIGGFVLALDGTKRPCAVRTSNAGHCLFAGIASDEDAAVQAATLMADDMYSGWGVRTLGAGERRHNPMSYHNGSVWPHDNAMIAAGLSRYRHNRAATAILTGMFEASTAVDLHCMPELFCGFPRRPGEGPTLYPVACAPQAWAAGSVYLLVQACLGLRVDALKQRVSFRYAALPDFLDYVLISGLRVGEGSVDLRLERGLHDVAVKVLARSGPVEIATYK